MGNGNESKQNTDNAEKINDHDREYLKTIVGSIKRARALLMTISVVAAWLLATQIVEIARWQYIRTPASHNIVHAAGKKLAGDTLWVRKSALRNIDRIDSTTDTNSTNSAVSWSAYALDSIGKASPDESFKWFLLHFPDTLKSWLTKHDDTVCLEFPNINSSFENKVDWCRQYYPYIINNWSDTNIALVRLILDRGEISNTKLPKDFVKRPQVDVPVVGMNVALDDLNVVGAILLLLGMLWFRFATVLVQENIHEYRLKHNTETPQRAYFESWLPMQFLFIERRRPHRANFEDDNSKVQVSHSPSQLKLNFSILCLFFIPFLVVFFSMLMSIYDIWWQNLAYDWITEATRPLTVHLDKNGSHFGTVSGVLLLRWVFLGTMAYFLAREGCKSWRTMQIVNCGAQKNGQELDLPAPSDEDRSLLRRHFIVLGLIPLVGFGALLLGRYVDLYYSMETHGWSYGFTIGGVMTIVAIMALLIGCVSFIWKRPGKYMERKP